MENKVYHYAYYLDGEYRQVAVTAVRVESAISKAREMRPETRRCKDLWFCYAEPKDAMETLRNYIAKYGTNG